MSLDACASNLAKGDPDRFRAAMCAPMPLRGDLVALYAFNLEVARAPFASDEPMIAEMRVQWWVDAVEEIFRGDAPRAHEVVGPLAQVLNRLCGPRGGEPPAGILVGKMIGDVGAIAEARRGDARREVPDLDRYLAGTGGALMALSAMVLGADAALVERARGYGWASAAAGYLVALPELKARGRPVAEVDGLAREALARLRAAKKGAVPRAVVPAFLPGFDAERVLARAFDAPGLVDAGRLQMADAPRRVAFAWAAWRGVI